MFKVNLYFTQWKCEAILTFFDEFQDVLMFFKAVKSCVKNCFDVNHSAIFGAGNSGLTYFKMSDFVTPWKHKKTPGLLTFSGGKEM